MSAGQFRDDVILQLAKAGCLPQREIELVNRQGGMLISVQDILHKVKEGC
jgi:hypothetical protein